MQKFGVECKVSEYRLFIDSSNRSLKAVLFHNGNNYASLSISHSVNLKENYENLELVLTEIGYTAHDWMICGVSVHASRSAGWLYQAPMFCV
jgi:hypothetical protein